MPRKIMKSDKYVDDVAPARPKKAGVMKSQSTHSAMKKGMWRDSNWKPIRDMTFLQYINSLRTQNAKKNPATTIANAGMTKPMQTVDTGTMKKPKLQFPKPTYNNPWAYIEGGNNELPKEKEQWVSDGKGHRRPPSFDPGFSPKNSPRWQEPFDPKNPHHTWQKFHPNIMISPIFRDWDKTHPKKNGFDL